MAPDSMLKAPEFARLKEVSDSTKLEIKPLPEDDAALIDMVTRFVVP
jgi:hypothetical protein